MGDTRQRRPAGEGWRRLPWSLGGAVVVWAAVIAALPRLAGRQASPSLGPIDVQVVDERGVAVGAGLAGGAGDGGESAAVARAAARRPRELRPAQARLVRRARRLRAGAAGAAPALSLRARRDVALATRPAASTASAAKRVLPAGAIDSFNGPGGQDAATGAPAKLALAAPNDHIKLNRESGAVSAATNYAARGSSPGSSPSSGTPGAALSDASGGSARDFASSGTSGGSSDTSARQAVAIYAPVPVLPDDLRADYRDEAVVARFEITAVGEASVGLVERTRDARLNALILDTLHRWRFAPAMRQGRAVPSVAELRIKVQVE